METGQQRLAPPSAQQTVLALSACSARRQCLRGAAVAVATCGPGGRADVYLRTRTGTTAEVVYLLTTLPCERASPANLLVRTHWHIENGLHSMRDATFGDNRCGNLYSARSSVRAQELGTLERWHSRLFFRISLDSSRCSLELP